VVTVYHVAGGMVTECWIHDAPERVADEALR
jgi:hypothetical protein